MPSPLQNLLIRCFEVRRHLVTLIGTRDHKWGMRFTKSDVDLTTLSIHLLKYLHRMILDTHQTALDLGVSGICCRPYPI